MDALSVFIKSLDALSETLELVPVIGPNLKKAAELGAKICEQIQVRERSVSDRRHDSKVAYSKSRRIVKVTSSSEFMSVVSSWRSPSLYRRPVRRTWAP
jgi:hypothetical protein